MAEIVLDNVTKRYPDGALAVDKINLDIADGEFVILVGPSGCGKSTTLNMIAGLEDITEGELRIGGKVVNNKSPKDRDIAMVFQSYALYPHMTVRENMGFALKLAKTPQNVINEKVEEAARILDLTQHLDRKPANLSGGQRQRVAMGRAIVRDPSAFLMDEPLSNLDAKLRVQMRTEVSRIQRRLGTTMVYVTHDQTEAMTLGRPGRGHAQRHAAAGGVAAGTLRAPGQPVRGRLHRLARDELHRPARWRRASCAPARGHPADRPAAAGAEPASAGRDVIVGVRPEDFEDASLVAARRPAATGSRSSATIDVVESMGSEYTSTSPRNSRAAWTRPSSRSWPRTPGGRTPGQSGDTVVARLDAATRISEGARRRALGGRPGAARVRPVHRPEPDARYAGSDGCSGPRAGRSGPGRGGTLRAGHRLGGQRPTAAGRPAGTGTAAALAAGPPLAPVGTHGCGAAGLTWNFRCESSMISSFHSCVRISR